MSTSENENAAADHLVASGGLLAPTYQYLPRYFAVVRMKPWRMRWCLWLRGEPTFDIDVYDRETIPKVLDSLPAMSVARGKLW